MQQVTMRPLDHHTRQQLNEHIVKIESVLETDAITIISPLAYGIDQFVTRGLELFSDKRDKITVILDTLGGVVEVVEQMVVSIRHHYKEVYFMIPSRAMSAGTIFAMSGDKIFMNYFSCLGPIDPQVQKDGRLVPALAYLAQYQRLSDKADSNNLNTAEYTLLNKFDLGELYQFEQAEKLSRELLVDWLSRYKFKNWNTHTSNGKPVTDKEKRERAEEVAKILGNTERWRSHGRGIFRNTLQDEIKLKIDNLEEVDNLNEVLSEYLSLLNDYMQREQYTSFVHTRAFF